MLIPIGWRQQSPNQLLGACLVILTILFALPPFALAVSKQTKDPALAIASATAPVPVMNSNYTDGSQFVARMCSAADGLNRYSSNYKMIVHKHRTPVTQSGSFAFAKTRLMRVEVSGGKNNGALAILQADGKVHGHLGGAMKFLKSSVSPDSPQVRAPNGYRMVDTDFYSLAAYLEGMLQKGDLSRLSSEPIQTGKTTSPTLILDVYSGKPGHEHLLKRVYTDPDTLLPVFWEDYKHGKLFAESSWTNLKTNVDFPSNFFRL